MQQKIEVRLQGTAGPVAVVPKGMVIDDARKQLPPGWTVDMTAWGARVLSHLPDGGFVLALKREVK